jgi:hypothetical protein
MPDIKLIKVKRHFARTKYRRKMKKKNLFFVILRISNDMKKNLSTITNVDIY